MQKSESQNGCFKKTKPAKFFRKTIIFYPMIRTRTLACFVFFKHPF